MPDAHACVPGSAGLCHFAVRCGIYELRVCGERRNRRGVDLGGGLHRDHDRAEPPRRGRGEEGIKASQVLSRIGSTLADLGDTAKVVQYVNRLKGIGIVNSRILIGAVFTTAFAGAAYVWPEISRHISWLDASSALWHLRRGIPGLLAPPRPTRRFGKRERPSHRRARDPPSKFRPRPRIGPGRCRERLSGHVRAGHLGHCQDSRRIPQARAR